VITVGSFQLNYSILFYSILFYSILFYSILFYSISITEPSYFSQWSFCKVSGVKAFPPEKETIMGWLGLAASRASHVHPRNNRNTGQRRKEDKTAELGFTYMGF